MLIIRLLGVVVDFRKYWQSWFELGVYREMVSCVTHAKSLEKCGFSLDVLWGKGGQLGRRGVF